MSWKLSEPLYRGDAAAGVAVPDPRAVLSVIDHILYLGGAGRATPFTSTSESRAVAERFSGRRGAVWMTHVRRATARGGGHLSRGRLLRDLRGRGRGAIGRSDAYLVARARVYVEQWLEHLLDWRAVSGPAIAETIRLSFDRD